MDNVENFLRQQREAGNRAATSEKQRVRISESEIDNRLRFYEDSTENFEVTDEHRRVMRHIFRDHDNVFITGGAGTGKTSLVNHVIIPELDHRGLMFAVTATTGLAGSHLGGKTLHSYMGLRKETIQWSPMENHPQDLDPGRIQRVYEQSYITWQDQLARKPQIRKAMLNRLRSLEVLILDEVSMAGGVALLGYIDYMLREIRGKDEAFGGVQIILVGDFCQIPPVEKGGHPLTHPDWAFLAPVWYAAQVVSLELTKIFRQADQVFANFLNQVRLGIPADPDYVRGFVRTIGPEEVDRYSFLVSKNADADTINDSALARFPGPTKIFPAEYVIHQEHFKWKEDSDEKIRKQLKGSRVIKDHLNLRVGVPVLFTVNDPGGAYVNGTRGIIKGYGPSVSADYDPTDGYAPPDANVDESDDDYCLLIEIEDEDAPGGVKTIALRRFFYSRTEKEPPHEMMSLMVDGKVTTTHRHPVLKQFPVIPATAITIHKSQGMSLDRAILHLDDTFAPGQVYVGLSRLRTAAGLVLTSDNFKVRTDRHAMEFYLQLREQNRKLQESNS